jgi:hypothetical protein
MYRADAVEKEREGRERERRERAVVSRNGCWM